MKRNFVFWMVALSLIALLFGCAPATPALPPEVPVTSVATEVPVAELVPLKYVGIKIWDPVIIAARMGFFKENGLDVEVLYGLGGANSIQAVASGKAQVGEASVASVILANQAGLPIQIVADFQTVNDERNIVQFYALKDSGIKTPADFAGKKIAVNVRTSSNEFTTIMLLQKYGVDVKSVEFVTVPIPEQVNALVTNAVDVILIPQPYQAYIEKDYGDKVKVITGDREAFGNRLTVGTFANRIWAQEHPEQARRFVSTLAKTMEWINASPENKAKAADIISVETGVPADLFVNLPFPYAKNGSINLDDIQFWMDFLKANGNLTAEFVTAKDVATNQYNDLVSCTYQVCFPIDGMLK